MKKFAIRVIGYGKLSIRGRYGNATARVRCACGGCATTGR